MTDKSSSSGGVGFLGLLTILFIGLKLTGHITWPWLWVLSPILAPVSVVVTMILAAAVWLASKTILERLSR